MTTNPNWQTAIGEDLDKIAEHWGLPPRVDGETSESLRARLAQRITGVPSLANDQDRWFAEFTDVDDFARLLQSGPPIDRISGLYGIERKPGETDDELKERLKRFVTADPIESLEYECREPAVPRRPFMKRED